MRGEMEGECQEEQRFLNKDKYVVVVEVRSYTCCDGSLGNVTKGFYK